MLLEEFKKDTNLISRRVCKQRKKVCRRSKAAVSRLTISSVRNGKLISGIAYARENGRALLMICFIKMQFSGINQRCYTRRNGKSRIY
jgi:hypothetical protein